jgi:long-subunit acyl-CoA synthetase (AMP-forming)
MMVFLRINNIFKLSTSTSFISPQSIESTLRSCIPCISKIFVYGTPARSFLVAIISIHVDSFIRWVEMEEMQQEEDRQKIELERFEDEVGNLIEWNTENQKTFSEMILKQGGQERLELEDLLKAEEIKQKFLKMMTREAKKEGLRR